MPTWRWTKWSQVGSKGKRVIVKKTKTAQRHGCGQSGVVCWGKVRADQIMESFFFLTFFILRNRILHRWGQNSGLIDPWLTVAANPHLGPTLRILCNSLSTVTERLNNVLKVTKPGNGTAALPPKQAGLTLYDLNFIPSCNLTNHCVQRNYSEGKSGVPIWGKD